MLLFPLTVPGTWLLLPGMDVDDHGAMTGDTRRAFEVGRHLSVLRHEFFKAVFSLNAYERVCAEVGQMRAELKKQREADPSGGWPGPELLIMERGPFVMAAAFVFALEHGRSMLVALSQEPDMPMGVGEAVERLDERIPHLVSVRHSAHHPEDRQRQRGRRGTPIVPAAAHNALVSAPAGAVMIMGSLVDDDLMWTGEDGEHAFVSITAATLKAAQQTIDEVHAAFKWTGWATTYSA